MTNEHESLDEVAQSSDSIDQPNPINPMEIVPSDLARSPIKISFGVKKKPETLVIKTKSESVAALDVAETSDEDIEVEERAAKSRKLTHFDNRLIPEEEEAKRKEESVVIPMVGELDTSKMEAEDADYNQVPLESFGLAYLRGCGAEIVKNPQKRMGYYEPKAFGTTPKTVDAKKNDENGDVVSQDIKRDDTDGVKKEEKRRDDRDESRKDDDSDLWVRVDCRVRMVSEDYENGNYLDAKMRVVDVADRKNITLEDDRGRTHYNICQTRLETVIPRINGEKVVILRGAHRGAKGVMVDKDRERESLQVSIMPTHEVVKVAFDDACMWTPQVVDLDDDDE